jgi:hypothetical protein
MDKETRSWSGTDTNMWWVMFLRFDYNLNAMVHVRYILLQGSRCTGC